MINIKESLLYKQKFLKTASVKRCLPILMYILDARICVGMQLKAIVFKKERIKFRHVELEFNFKVHRHYI